MHVYVMMVTSMRSVRQKSMSVNRIRASVENASTSWYRSIVSAMKAFVECFAPRKWTSARRIHVYTVLVRMNSAITHADVMMALLDLTVTV